MTSEEIVEIVRDEVDQWSPQPSGGVEVYAANPATTLIMLPPDERGRPTAVVTFSDLELDEGKLPSAIVRCRARNAMRVLAQNTGYPMTRAA